jgi:asparagine synthase (glutamine-hydrolysing)
MCGIAGLLCAPNGPPPDRNELLRMAAMLQHRGPDGYGLYRDARCGLAHTRLSLLDLEGGHQPLTNEDRSLWIVGNGEIFGHLTLRRELEGHGHVFRTSSDIEVIVHAYEQWGAHAWERLDGQFAFALWDQPQQRLWLVRDRFGILPLHFAVRPDAIVFGSEQKALFAGGRVPVAFSAAGLTEVFSLWTTLPPRTVFAGVQQVQPGEAVYFDGQLQQHCQRFGTLELAPTEHPHAPSLDVSAAALGERLDAAVQTRLHADVPVGTYLSGGIDSSVITALARRHAPQLHTFALRFEDPAYDETDAQRRVANLLGTEHHEVLCTDRDVRANLPEVVWHCETPLLRTAPVPMFMLSSLVRAHGIKAVLTGEGADELLAGYSIFQEARVRRFWARQPQSRWRPSLFARVHDFVADHAQRSGAMWQAFYARGLSAVHDPYYSHRIRWQNTQWASRVLAPDVLAATPPLDACIAATLPPGFARFSNLERAQALEIATFLSPYLLASQGDRVALGHGIEARYPFLDPAVVTLCATMPTAHKLRGLRTKIALRMFAASLLPPEVCLRPKRPYRAPTASALLGKAPADYVDELLSVDRLRDNPLLDPTAATALVAKARRRAGQGLAEREAMALTGVLSLQVLTDQFQGGLQRRVTDATTRLSRQSPRIDVDVPSRSGRSPA